MNYPFICVNSKCKNYNNIINIEMKMKDYTPLHFCPDCGKEMTREVNSLVCGLSVDTTGDFYRKCN